MELINKIKYLFGCKSITREPYEEKPLVNVVMTDRAHLHITKECPICTRYFTSLIAKQRRFCSRACSQRNFKANYCVEKHAKEKPARVKKEKVVKRHPHIPSTIILNTKATIIPLTAPRDYSTNPHGKSDEAHRVKIKNLSKW
jgi:hypothetical protein